MSEAERTVVRMSGVVRTHAGDVRGSTTETGYAFRGIPYAAPPTGANRLRPPQPVQRWDGVRDATRLGPEPPQVAPPSTGGTASGPAEDWEDVDEAFAKVERANGTDDCLNLNLWTPDPGAADLPVMVWIQGGMFELSSTAAYDGRRFARDGVVCVVINWRPGAEGFLYLDDGIADVGLLDQVAALEWVRENISAFGGDPGNVTVFGESAGAMSIGTLLAMPRAEGLFRRAILQSGAAHHVLPVDDALRIGRDLARRLGVPPTRADIAAAGVDRLLAAQAALKADLLAHPDPDQWGSAVVAGSMPWQPVVEGDVVPAAPIERIAGGSATGVDVVVGTNTEDWRLWLLVSGMLAQVTDEMLTGEVAVHGPRSITAYGLPVDAALAAYRDRYPDTAPGEVLAAVQTDWWMRIPALRLAEAHAAAGGRTWMYEFAWPAPGLGAVHAIDIPFVFDTLAPDAPLFGPMLGADPPQVLADAMHTAWIAFAATGDPGWPAYDLDRRATMRFDTTTRVVEDPRAWERSLWDGRR